MDVVVSGRKIHVSDRLRETTTEKIGRLARFIDGLDHAEVHFMEERNPRIRDKDICEVTVAGHGHHLRAKVSAPDPFTAVDLVVDKLEHQLHKLKTRVINRNHAGPKGSVHSPNGAIDDVVEPDDTRDDDIRIVKSKRFLMKPMTPSEAAIQMDLVNHDFFFFTNAETGRAAVVYRRHDGAVGLIDEAG